MYLSEELGTSLYVACFIDPLMFLTYQSTTTHYSVLIDRWKASALTHGHDSRQTGLNRWDAPLIDIPGR
jgi:hypothetical protein